MAVPKRKTSKMRSRHRKAGQRAQKKKTGLRTDKKTGAKHLSHRVDPKTGLYRGKQVLTVKTETEE